MEVKIGVQSIPRELVVETAATAEEVEERLRAAVTDGGLFIVHNDKGSTTLVPAGKIGYVEISGAEQRRVGFGNR